MSKSDIEMDDAERGSNDSETKDREFDNKEPDTNIKGEGGKLPCVAAVFDDANRTKSGVEDVNQSINEGKDIDKDNIEVQEQTNPESEGNEPVDGSNQEKTNIVGENEKRIDTKMGDEGVADLRSAVEGQKDIKNEVLQQNITCGGENGQKSTENGLDGENHETIVEEKSKEKVAEKECEELVMGDADHIENVEGDNKTSSDGGVGHGENDEGDNQKMKMEDTGNDPSQNTQLPTELSTNNAPQTENVEMGEAPQTQNVEMGEASQTQTVEMGEASQTQNVEMGEASQTQNVEMGEAPQSEVDEMKDSTYMYGDKPIADNETEEDGNTVKDGQEEQGVRAALATPETNENVNTVESTAKYEEDSSFANQQEPSTPNSLIIDSLSKAGDHNEGTAKSILTPSALPLMGENDDGTPEEQAAFMKEIESFYRKKAVDFKPPKFYGQPLNCLKLWRAVIRLGGYDRVTGSKLWRQVGESFHPPKTCTTVSWTFRIFYEKSLLEYERHKTQSGEVNSQCLHSPEVSGVDVEGNGFQGSGRARRDAAARAMQGWHAQRLSDYGEVGEPIIKDKNLNNVTKREKNLKSIGSLKQKRPSEAEQSNKAPRTEASKQLATSVVDVGPPADWVKINVRQTKDCFEIYALVPGLLREEVRVQTDPAGRVVITGQPDQLDNPWGITPFKKVVSLPSRIDPLQTSAVVSLHGRLFVRVPFEQLNA